MDWPTGNPDMNPLKQSIRRNIPALMPLREFKQVVLVEWENILQKTIIHVQNNGG